MTYLGFPVPNQVLKDECLTDLAMRLVLLLITASVVVPVNPLMPVARSRPVLRPVKVPSAGTVEAALCALFSSSAA